MTLATPRRFIVVALALLIAALSATPAMAARHQKMRTYTGAAVVTAVDAENDVFSADLYYANRALRNALGGDLSDVQISVDDNTDFSINEDPLADFSDLCSDDVVRFVIKTRDRLSGHDLTDHPAAVVTAWAEPGDCLDDLQ
jgi:hypothetical protein